MSRSFGKESAGKIGSLLGDDIVEDIGARTVGKLIKQVTNKGKGIGLDEDGMSQLVNHLKQGMAEVGSNPKTKLNYWQGKPITVGLTNPLKLGLKGNFIEKEIQVHSISRVRYPKVSMQQRILDGVILFMRCLILSMSQKMLLINYL